MWRRRIIRLIGCFCRSSSTLKALLGLKGFFLGKRSLDTMSHGSHHFSRNPHQTLDKCR